jgi:outer membrane biosynthesis protein TonB
MGRAARALVCVVMFGACTATAQEPMRPAFTMGDVALLANQSPNETTEPLRQALLDPDPRVRAVAARVAGSSARADLWIRDVKPIYPTSAQQRGIQGVVFIDTEIAPSGCINSARIVRIIPRSISPLSAPCWTGSTNGFWSTDIQSAC